MGTDTRAATVEAYLAGLEPGRRATVSAVRDVINGHLPAGYREGVQHGMIGWSVPHELYPAGYHCDPAQPVPFVSLASQKNHVAVYMFCLYTDPAELARFEAAWKKSGKRLDMGKSCVRFKDLDGACLEAIGEAVGRVPVKKFLATYEAGLGQRAAGGSTKGAKKAAAKKAPKKAGAKKASKKVAKPAAKKATKKAAKVGTKKTAKKAPSRRA